jgi:hypothetical protein
LDPKSVILPNIRYFYFSIFKWLFNSLLRNMGSEEIHKELLEKLHKEHAFWSYDNPESASISDEMLIASVLLHLDIDDVLRLFKLFPRRKIQKVWKEKMLAQEPMYHGLNRLYSFLLFNIKHPDKYIRDFKNRRYKSQICKD